MRNRFLIATVIAGALTSAPMVGQLHAQAATTSTPQVITTGVGEAQATPDRATIFIGVQSRATTAAAAAADNARRQKAVLDTLRKLGLRSDQLSTINYNVSPEMAIQNQPGSGYNGPPKVVGYMVTNSVRAQVERIEDVGKLIDAALAKGANEISSLQFTSSKADSVRRVALAEAVANARADAEALAMASGGTLGQLIEISTTSQPIRPVMYGQLAMAKAMAPTPIEPGEMTVTANVTAKWAVVVR